MPLSQNRAATAFAFGVQAFAFLSLSTRLPEFQDRWEISNDTTSLVMLALVLMAGLGSVGAEWVARRIDSAAVLRTGFVIIAAAFPLIMVSESLALAGPAMALYGLGLGAVDAGSNMQAVAIEHRYGRPLLPSFHGAWTLGAILGSGLTVISGSWSNAALASIAVLPLLAALAPYLRGDATIPDLSAEGLPRRPILLVGVAMMLFYTVDTAIQTWGSTYAHDVFDTSKDHAAWAVAVYLIASGLVRLAGDRAVSRWGAPLLVRVGAVVGAAGLAVIVAAPNWPVSLVGFALTGAGLAVVAPLSFSTAAALAGGEQEDPAARQARVDAAIARFNLFNYAGGLLGSVMTGFVGGSQIQYGFVLPAILALALLPLARLFIGQTPRPTAHAS